MVLPLFKTHYSQSKSILTLEKKDSLLPDGPDSVIDICLENGIKEFYLVEDNMGSFLQAYDSTKDEDLSFRYGVRLNVCSDNQARGEEALKSTSKYVIFAKNENGYKKLIKIYSNAATKGFYYEPRTDFKFLREVWDDNDLVLAVPFYDSFLFKNALGQGECMPEFDFTSPTFLLESNGLPFDIVQRRLVEDFCRTTGYESQEAKSIYYKNKDDFMAYLTMRCIDKRSTWSKPNIDNLSSDEFSFESWKEKQEA